jgi:hypothetical protein
VSDAGGWVTAVACGREYQYASFAHPIGAHHSCDVDGDVLADDDADSVQAHELSKVQMSPESWRAERIGPTIIAAPHCGHLHVAPAAVFVEVAVVAMGAGAGREVASAVRASDRRIVRRAFARNPDWRMRTKPRGRMCWTKRRRNSMALSVIVRRWLPRA